MIKRIIETAIMEQSEIADGIYRISLARQVSAADEFSQAEPGQFVNLYLGDKSMLLPRPISICRLESDRLSLVYRVVGKGTKELSACKAGDLIRISTPLGHGYDVASVFNNLAEYRSSTVTIALTAGGLGVPPMLELAKTIRKRIRNDGNGCRTDCNYRLVSMVGFQAQPFLTDELREFCDEVHIATDNGSAGFRGNVLELMKSRKIQADYYLSCGPKPMLKALAEFCGRENKPIQVSLEERMGCGYGACVGCTCRTKEGQEGDIRIKQKKVCKDGPVFFGNEVVWDE